MSIHLHSLPWNMTALTVTACIGLAFGGVVEPAVADVDAAYANSSTWTFEITHVPDFDQRRDTLPNTGSMYCVPTASMNWMAYFSNHGATWLPPWPAWWQSQDKYADATDAIANLGTIMGTNPNNGTGTSGALNGLNTWLIPDPLFVVSGSLSSFFFSPTHQDLATHTLNGGYTLGCVGWYDLSGYPVISRSFGHCITIVAAARSGGSRVVGIHDPAAHEGDLTVQSTFATEEYEVLQEFVIPNGLLPRFMSRFAGYGTAYLDKIYAIYPIFVLTTPPDELNGVFVNFAFTSWGASVPQLQGFELGQGDDTLVDLVVHPDLTCIVYLSRATPNDAAKAWILKPGINETKPLPIPTSDPTELLVGRLRGLFVIDDGDIVKFNVDLPDGPQEVVRHTLPGSTGPMTYCDETDEVAVLSVDDAMIYTYPHHMDVADPAALALPADVPLGGEASMAWDPVRGGFWIVSEASDELWHVLPNPFGAPPTVTMVAHESIVAPTSVQVGDGGDVFVATAGHIVQMSESLEEGLVVWSPAQDPLFPDTATGPIMVLARSQSNYDPAIHDGPEWRNELPEEFGASKPECTADLNDDRSIDILDLLTLLAAWGDCPDDAFCHEDLDYSGDVGTTDLLAVLANWGLCP